MSLVIPMNLVLLFSTVFLFIGSSFSEEAVTPDVVNVGAIFSFNSINGKVAKAAMKAAENDINSDPSILGGRKFSITLLDSDFSEFFGLIGGMLFVSFFNLLSFYMLD